MKTEDIFGLIIRTAGLLMAVSGISTACRWLHATAVRDVILFGVPYVAITVYLLRGAPHLVRFSYPDKRKVDADEQNT